MGIYRLYGDAGYADLQMFHIKSNKDYHLSVCGI